MDVEMMSDRPEAGISISTGCCIGDMGSTSKSKLVRTAQTVRSLYEREFSDEHVMFDVLCKTAVQIIEHFQDPVKGWDFNQERSEQVTDIVNIFFPRYGFDIPWKVSYENVATYRKLILFGLRPYVAPGSNERLAAQLMNSYQRWLDGTWTPAETKYRQDGTVNSIPMDREYIPTTDEIDEILFKVENLTLTA